MTLKPAFTMNSIVHAAVRLWIFWEQFSDTLVAHAKALSTWHRGTCCRCYLTVCHLSQGTEEYCGCNNYMAVQQTCPLLASRGAEGNSTGVPAAPATQHFDTGKILKTLVLERTAMMCWMVRSSPEHLDTHWTAPNG
jgi:hypothetical protein